MNNKNQRIKPTFEPPRVTAEGVDSFVKYLMELLEKLRSSIKILPKVDQDGRYECPFAGTLYAKKDEAIEPLINKLKEAPYYLDAIANTINKYMQNLATINKDAGNLNSKEAREKYEQAIKATEYQIEVNEKRRSDLLDVMKQAEELISLARSKKWPGAKPEEHSYPPVGLVAAGVIGSNGPLNINNIVTPDSNTKMNKELDNLVGLGPIGKPNSL